MPVEAANAGVALAGRDIVTDSMPANRITAAVPQIIPKAFLASIFIAFLSVADNRWLNALFLFVNVSFYTHKVCLLFVKSLTRLNSSKIANDRPVKPARDIAKFDADQNAITLVCTLKNGKTNKAKIRQQGCEGDRLLGILELCECLTT